MGAKVSIIVPVYNVEPYIHRCMKSLINQTLKDIEIILVDDESPDNCGKICEEYARKDKRIKVIHKKNQGLGLARNSGLKVATGEYVAFVDSDDYVALDMYEKMYLRAKSENADTCFCSYNVEYCDGTKKVQNILTKKDIYIEDEVVNNILFEMLGVEPAPKMEKFFVFSVWRAIYSRDILSRNNITFCSEREFISEDIIFHLDYLPYSKKIVIEKDALYNYWQNNESLTKEYRKDRFNKNKILYFEILRKVKKLGIYELVNSRVDNSFIDSTRYCIMEEVRYSNENGYSVALRNIKNICEDSTIQEVIERYPIARLPIKFKIFSTFIKYKMPRMLFVLVRLHKKQ